MTTSSRCYALNQWINVYLADGLPLGQRRGRLRECASAQIAEWTHGLNHKITVITIDLLNASLVRAHSRSFLSSRRSDTRRTLTACIDFSNCWANSDLRPVERVTHEKRNAQLRPATRSSNASTSTTTRQSALACNVLWCKISPNALLHDTFSYSLVMRSISTL